MLNNEKEGSTK